MTDAFEPVDADALSRREDLPQILEMVRAVIRELARRKLTPLLAAREDASDLAQSVVLELIQSGESLEFRGPEATRALARTILGRLVSDKVRALRTHKRDCGREQRWSEDDGSRQVRPPFPVVASADPAQLAEASELLAMGEARMALLSERERQVVRRRGAGEGHREIAAALGISEALSQRLLSDARRKLRGD